MLGHPWAACQARFGASRRSAIPAAIHGSRVRNVPRSKASNATADTAIRKAIVYFASIPMPATTPSSGQRRGSGRTRIRTMT